MNEFDVVVIGGAAAGLSAALVLSRARRTVLVVDSGAPRNAPARHMHGFLSRDGLPPADLLAAGRQEVTGYGGRVLAGTVTDVTAGGSAGFHLLLADGSRVSARRLLLARPGGRTPGHPRTRRPVGPRRPALPVLPRLRGP